MLKLARLVAVVMLGQATLVSAQQGTDAIASAPEEFTLKGEVALWTVAIKPDKTADFERVMNSLRQALTNSDDLQRREQAKGWQVFRLDKPLSDGNVGYVHVIRPVVEGADYSVMQVLYDELPDQRQELYELYRGAFAQNVGLAQGDVAVDMSTAAATGQAVAAR
jgi:hypothetical protein